MDNARHVNNRISRPNLWRKLNWHPMTRRALCINPYFHRTRPAALWQSLRVSAGFRALRKLPASSCEAIHTQETRVSNVEDDVAGIIRQALPLISALGNAESTTVWRRLAAKPLRCDSCTRMMSVPCASLGSLLHSPNRREGH